MLTSPTYTPAGRDTNSAGSRIDAQLNVEHELVVADQLIMTDISRHMGIALDSWDGLLSLRAAHLRR